MPQKLQISGYYSQNLCHITLFWNKIGIFLLKNLHMSKKKCNFALNF